MHSRACFSVDFVSIFMALNHKFFRIASQIFTGLLVLLVLLVTTNYWYPKEDAFDKGLKQHTNLRQVDTDHAALPPVARLRLKRLSGAFALG
jgi:hypothetical protein